MERPLGVTLTPAREESQSAAAHLAHAISMLMADNDAVGLLALVQGLSQASANILGKISADMQRLPYNAPQTTTEAPKAQGPGGAVLIG